MWRIKIFILTHTHKSSFMAHIRVSDEFVPLWESLNYFSSQLTSLITYNLIKFTMRLGKRSISLIMNKLISSLAGLESPALGSRLKGCPRQANNRREQHIHQGCLNGGCLLGAQIIYHLPGYFKAALRATAPPWDILLRSCGLITDVQSWWFLCRLKWSFKPARSPQP